MKINKAISLKGLLLALPVSIGFTAGISTVVACNSSPRAQTMNAEVLKDLGLTDSDGKSTVVATLEVSAENVALLTSKQLKDITADKLISEEKKAKSEGSFNFLTSTLGLKAKDGDKWDARVFEATEVEKAKTIKLKVGEFSPTFVPASNNEAFAIKEGFVSVEWKSDSTSYGKYSVDLKGDPASPVIIGDNVNKIKQDDLGTIEGLAVDGDVTKFKVGNKITPTWDAIKPNIKELDSIAKLLNQTAELKVKTNAKTDGKFESNDKVVFNIAFGDVTLAHDIEYTIA